jgi:hypothetical protein
MYKNVSPEEAAAQLKSLDEANKETIQYAYSIKTKIFTEVERINVYSKKYEQDPVMAEHNDIVCKDFNAGL